MNQAPNWNALEQMALDDLLGVLWGDPGVVRPIGVDHHVNALLAWPKAGTAVESCGLGQAVLHQGQLQGLHQERRAGSAAGFAGHRRAVGDANENVLHRKWVQVTGVNCCWRDSMLLAEELKLAPLEKEYTPNPVNGPE